MIGYPGLRRVRRQRDRPGDLGDPQARLASASSRPPACCATGVTAYHLLEATGVGLGDTVLVHGVSGGVGLTTAQLAIDRGATVIGTAAAAAARHAARLRHHPGGVRRGAGGPGAGAGARRGGRRPGHRRHRRGRRHLTGPGAATTTGSPPSPRSAGPSRPGSSRWATAPAPTRARTSASHARLVLTALAERGLLRVVVAQDVPAGRGVRRACARRRGPRRRQGRAGPLSRRARSAAVPGPACRSPNRCFCGGFLPLVLPWVT